MAPKTFLSRVWDATFQVLTFTYNRSLQHYTLRPIAELESHQDDVEKVRHQLQVFKTYKEEELSHVKKASTLSAAAVIGIFSWPSIDNAFWVSTLFLHCSLWLSVMALISASQRRLLEHLPQSKEEAKDLPNAEVKVLLLTLLHARKRDLEQAEGRNLVFKRNRKLLWVWQTPMMQMSLSWFFFLIGYALCLVTPLVGGSDSSPLKEKISAVVSLFVGVLAVANFLICSFLSQWALGNLREARRHIPDTEEKSTTPAPSTGESTEKPPDPGQPQNAANRKGAGP